jgi:hypothetical protein
MMKNWKVYSGIKGNDFHLGIISRYGPRAPKRGRFPNLFYLMYGATTFLHFITSPRFLSFPITWTNWNKKDHSPQRKDLLYYNNFVPSCFCGQSLEKGVRQEIITRQEIIKNLFSAPSEFSAVTNLFIKNKKGVRQEITKSCALLTKKRLNHRGSGTSDPKSTASHVIDIVHHNILRIKTRTSSIVSHREHREKQIEERGVRQEIVLRRGESCVRPGSEFNTFSQLLNMNRLPVRHHVSLELKKGVRQEIIKNLFSAFSAVSNLFKKGVRQEITKSCAVLTKKRLNHIGGGTSNPRSTASHVIDIVHHNILRKKNRTSSIESRREHREKQIEERGVKQEIVLRRDESCVRPGSEFNTFSLLLNMKRLPVRHHVSLELKKRVRQEIIKNLFSAPSEFSAVTNFFKKRVRQEITKPCAVLTKKRLNHIGGGTSNPRSTASHVIDIVHHNEKGVRLEIERRVIGSTHRVGARQEIVDSSFTPAETLYRMPVSSVSKEERETIAGKSFAARPGSHGSCNRRPVSVGRDSIGDIDRIDITRLTDRVYKQMEKRIKMERERRGW